MEKIFLHALSISKKHNMIAFWLWRVPQENGANDQLLHAIKAFCGANWSFVVN